LTPVADAKKSRTNPTFSWIDLSFLPISDIGLVVFLILIVLVGVYVVIYAVAFAFTHLLSLGEVNRARIYGNNIERYGLDDDEGITLASKLYRTTLYFSAILLVFTLEEGSRYLLHTGAADLFVWIFRFGCLGVATLLTGVFFVRLHRWLSFKSTSKFEKTSKQIRELQQLAH
jgi:hypothetical protein